VIDTFPFSDCRSAQEEAASRRQEVAELQALLDQRHTELEERVALVKFILL